jgi:hypothetical protein
MDGRWEEAQTDAVKKRQEEKKKNLRSTEE